MMPPKTRPIAPGAPVGERLARIETLLEAMADRQAEQHEENVERADNMARETKEHRHRTNNAMQEVTGRLAKIERTTEANAATIVDILTVKAPEAAEDRKDLRERLEALEKIIVGAKASWKVIAGLAAIIVGVAAGAIKIAEFFGSKP